MINSVWTSLTHVAGSKTSIIIIGQVVSLILCGCLHTNATQTRQDKTRPNIQVTQRGKNKKGKSNKGEKKNRKKTGIPIYNMQVEVEVLSTNSVCGDYGTNVETTDIASLSTSAATVNGPPPATMMFQCSNTNLPDFKHSPLRQRRSRSRINHHRYVGKCHTSTVSNPNNKAAGIPIWSPTLTHTQTTSTSTHRQHPRSHARAHTHTETAATALKRKRHATGPDALWHNVSMSEQYGMALHQKTTKRLHLDHAHYHGTPSLATDVGLEAGIRTSAATVTAAATAAATTGATAGATATATATATVTATATATATASDMTTSSGHIVPSALNIRVRLLDGQHIWLDNISAHTPIRLLDDHICEVVDSHSHSQSMQSKCILMTGRGVPLNSPHTNSTFSMQTCWEAGLRTGDTILQVKIL
jgi:hypothetical protein